MALPLNSNDLSKVLTLATLIGLGLAAVYKTRSGSNSKPSERLVQADRPSPALHDVPYPNDNGEAGVPGALSNTTATICFLNAVIQSLASCRPLINELNRVQDQPLHKALAYVITNLNELSGGGKVYEAQGVVDAMLRPRGSDKDKRARVMEAGQQDAHEFIQELLSRLVDENEEHYARLAAGIAGLSAATWLCEASAQRKQFEGTAFCGRASTLLVCERCGQRGVERVAVFNNITLQLPNPHAHRMSLADCLAANFASEELNDFTCWKCTVNAAHESHADPDGEDIARLSKMRLANTEPAAGSRDADLLKTLRPVTGKVRKESWVRRLPPMLCLHVNRNYWVVRNDAPALAKSYCVIDFPEELDMAPYTKPTPAPKPLGAQSEHGPRSGSALLIGDPDALAQRLRTSLRLGARIELPRGSSIVSASADNGQPPDSHAGPANDMHRSALGHRLANGSAGEHNSDAEEVLGDESGVGALPVDLPMKSARTVEYECRQAPLLDDATTSGISNGNLQPMTEIRQVSEHDRSPSSNQQSTHEIAPGSQSQSAHAAAAPMTAAATHEPQPGAQSQTPEPLRARIIARTWASYTDDARRDPARVEGSAYTLWAVVVHHGSAMGGHFTAYRRLGPDSWYRLSDTQVKRVSLDEVLSVSAYLLFYERNDVIAEAEPPEHSDCEN